MRFYSQKGLILFLVYYITQIRKSFDKFASSVPKMLIVDSIVTKLFSILHFFNF